MNLDYIKIFQEFAKFNIIKYYDEPHKYYINGKQCISVTTLIHKFEPPFDEDYWSERKALETGVTKEEKLAEWKFIKDVACVKGSLTHNYTENYINNKIFPYPYDKIKLEFNGEDPIFERFEKCRLLSEKFCNEIQNKLIPIRSELVVGCPQLMITGMIDQVFYNIKSGMLEIWDWKTNKELKDKNRYKLFKPLDHLTSAQMDIYSLQLQLYQYLIEKVTDLKFGDRYIVWFNEVNDNYVIRKCHDYRNEVDAMIKYYLKNKSEFGTLTPQLERI